MPKHYRRFDGHRQDNSYVDALLEGAMRAHQPSKGGTMGMGGLHTNTRGDSNLSLTKTLPGRFSESRQEESMKRLRELNRYRK